MMSMNHQSPPFVYCVVGDLITSGLLSTESCQLCSHTLVHKQHTHRRQYRERRRANGERVNPNPIYRCLEFEGEREGCLEEVVEEEEAEPLHCEVSLSVSIYLSIYLSVCLPTYLSIYLSIYLFVYVVQWQHIAQQVLPGWN